MEEKALEAELEQIRDRLREREEEWHLLYNTLPSGCFIVNEACILKDVNDFLCALTGFERAELVGQSCATICPTAPPKCPILEQSQERIDNVETWIRTKDGRRVPVIKSARRLRMGDREVIVETLQDITERRQAAQALEERQKYLERVLASVPDAIITLDAEHRVVEWNPSAERLFGYTPDQARGHDLDELITIPDVLDEAIQLTQQALQGKTTGPLETVRYRRDGSPVAVIVTGSPIFVGDELIGLVAIYTDITERKRAEDALHQSEEFNRTLIEHSPIGISVRSPTGQLLFYNRAWQRIWAMSDEQVAADLHPRSHLAFDASDEYLAPYQDELKRVYEIGGSLHIPEIQVENPRPDKAEWISQHFYAIQNDRGQVDRVVILTQDISEHKWSEQVLRQRNNEVTTLYNAAIAISSALSLDTVLQTVAEQITQAIGADGCTLSLWDREHDRVETLVDYAQHPACTIDILGTTYDLDAYPATRHVLETGQPLIIHRDDPLANEAERAIMEQYDVQTLLMLPLIARDRVLGLAELSDTTAPRDYTPDQLRLVQSLTAHAAIAIENARLYEQAQQEVTERKLTEDILLQRNRELAFLNQAGRAFSSTLDLDQVLAIVMEEVRSLLDVTALSLWLIDPETDEVVCRQASGSHSQVVQGWRLARGEGIVGWAVQHGESVIVPDLRYDSRHLSDVDQHTGMKLRSILSVPLIVRETVIGALQVVDMEPNRFGPADQALIEPLAASASVAIENARLHQALRDHAEHLEQRVRERTAELEAQYARLDAILHNTADGILVTDADGQVIQANPVAQTWLTQTLSPEDEARLREAVYDLALQAAERPTTALELKGLDLELRAAPISVPGMENLAAVVDIHDVSHLRALDRMKNRFISNISHELRTPITTIKLCAHLMNRQPEHWRGHLNNLTQEAEHQARLVESILQISRLDAGRLEMAPRPTSLDELAESIVTSRQILAQEKDLVLEYRAAASQPVLALVDPGWMTQVLDNLIGNAIRYTLRDGAIVVSIATHRAQGRPWATITVSDTGIGIPADELPHVFERFFRGEKPRTMQLTGTGLGLSIVKEIVELHGGWVTLDSQEDVGSTFTVWLPLITPRTDALSEQ